MKKQLSRRFPAQLALMTVALLGGVACNNTPATPTQGQVTPQPGNVQTFAALGLQGEYYASGSFTGPRTVQTDGQINFNWGKSAAVRGQRPGNLSVRWKGQVLAQKTGIYTLSLTSAGGTGRLLVSGQATNIVKLQAGVPVDIQVEFQQSGENPAVKLEWESADAGVKREIVPVGRLGQVSIRGQNVTTGSVPRGQNLITNGDFESGTGSWTYGFDTTAGVAGNAAQLGAGGYLQQNLSREVVEVGAPYTLTASVKSSAGQPSSCTVGLATFDAYGNVSKQTLAFTSIAAGQWTKDSLKFSPQPGQTLMSIYLQSNDGDCAFDDVSLQVDNNGTPNPIATNWLKDSDFEQTTALATWNTNGQLVQPGAQNSANALSVTNSSWSQQDLSAEVIQGLKPGQEFTLTADGKALNGGGCLVGFRGGNGSDVLFTKWLDFRNSDWKTASISGTIPAGMTWGAVFLADGLQECQYDNVQVGAIGNQLPPLPDPSTKPIYVPVPIASPSGTVVFNLSDIEADSFSWTFSDGSTDTGDYIEHKFTKPGIYTATANVRRQSGEQQTYSTNISVLPEIADIAKKRATSDSMFVDFDAGEPLPGMEYRYEFSDNTSYNGSKIRKHFDKLGTFDYKLTVIDHRDQPDSLTVPQSLRQQTTPANPTVYEEHSWTTVFKKPPHANFKASSSDDKSMTTPFIMGRLPFNVKFDASDSFDENTSIDGDQNQLKYDWEFGDGSIGSGIDASHIYTRAGIYPVTLTVTDSYGLKDTYSNIVHVREVYSNFKMNVTQKDPMAISQAFTLDTAKLNSQGLDHIVVDYFPYILPASNEITGGKFASLDLNGKVINSFCANMQFQVNNLATPEPIRIGVSDLGTDAAGNPQFCSQMVATRGVLGIVPASFGVNVTAYSSSYVNDVRFAVFDRLVVPKISVDVLPDEFIPGERPSPDLQEYVSKPDPAGNVDWLLQVHIRESDIRNGSVTFKIPIAAVDKTDAFLPTATGRFKASFVGTGYTSECDDCTMVNGLGHIKVTIPLSTYDLGNLPLDFSKVKLETDNDCGVTDLYSGIANMRLDGCSTIPVSTRWPKKRAPEKLTYSYDPYGKFGNKIFYGPGAAHKAFVLKGLASMSADLMHYTIDVLAPYVFFKEKWNQYLSVAAEKINNDQLGWHDDLQLAGMGFGLTFGNVPVFMPGMRSVVAESIVSTQAVPQAELLIIREGAAAKAETQVVANEINESIGKTVTDVAECPQSCTGPVGRAIESASTDVLSGAKKLEQQPVSNMVESISDKTKRAMVRNHDRQFEIIKSRYSGNDINSIKSAVIEFASQFKDLKFKKSDNTTAVVIEFRGKKYYGISGDSKGFDPIEVNPEVKEIYKKIGDGSSPFNGTCGEAKALTRLMAENPDVYIRVMEEGGKVRVESNLAGAQSAASKISPLHPNYGKPFKACQQNCTPVYNSLGIIDLAK